MASPEAAEVAEAADTTATDFSHVIDWTEAMEQCGDDEDFLRELLSDLRGEIDAQIVKIDAVLEVRETVGLVVFDEGNSARVRGGDEMNYLWTYLAHLFSSRHLIIN